MSSDPHHDAGLIVQVIQGMRRPQAVDLYCLIGGKASELVKGAIGDRER